MFKILSWFVGLVIIFFIGYFLLKNGNQILNNSSTWFANLNSGNQQLLQNLNSPNGVNQDNSNSAATDTITTFLDKIFPGLFPLFKVGNGNYGPDPFPKVDNSNQNVNKIDSIQTKSNYENVMQNESINAVIREVNFAR